MLKKIKALTKIFIKDFYQSTNIVDKETKKINKKSIYFWLLIVLSIAMIYISYEGIHFFQSNGMPEMFLNIYLIFLAILLTFQISVVATNVFFFSKDLEFILPLPVTSKELLVAKFNTILFMSYIAEAMFGLFPLILYGFMNFTTFMYFIWLLIILLTVPIIFITVISFLVIILMKIFSFIKSKVILQNLISIILILGLLQIEQILMGSIDNIKETNNMISPIINILTSGDFLSSLGNILIILVIDAILLILFILISQKLYLKLILKNISSNRRLKRAEKKEINIKNKNNNLKYSYIKKEIKMLIKQPIFFMQTIFPVIMVLLTLIIIANVFIPVIDSTIQNDETIKNSIASLSFSAEMICVILGILQCIFSIPKLSLTAISREGKNAIFMKYIPVSLYKQFLYKNVLQIIVNIVVSIVVLGLIYYYIPAIGLINILLMFIISIFINLINSYLMVIVDLRKPYLNWNSEYSVIKRNDNKSFQYALTITMILTFLYLSNIFKEVNVTLTLGIEIIIFMIIFIIIDRIVKKNIQNIFDKIY